MKLFVLNTGHDKMAVYAKKVEDARYFAAGIAQQSGYSPQPWIKAKATIIRPLKTRPKLVLFHS